ncbi:MAG: 16S rRNA (adenine(1518)-N(6)/adenine(1519)-N(6))-dimethyltransferase RsmA [Bryobacteraceae bacterium]
MGRRFGQHFLARQSVLERIARAACPEHCDLLLEIGPGRGALTLHLLEHASRVVAIEIDPVLVQYLRSKFRERQNLEIVDNDILKADLSSYGPLTVVGNLPYYITSPIIQKVLALGPQLAHAVFLVQKEVAERLTASPGTRDYGYLSVQTQLLSKAELLFTVPAAAFRPPPKVDSALVRLTPRPELPVADPAAFLQFASAAFHQKRKTLRNNLLGSYEKDILDALPETKQRAEQLSINELIALWESLTPSFTHPTPPSGP